jgi:hypothetical protein
LPAPAKLATVEAVAIDDRDFRPFAASDDGTCLLLIRRRTFQAWVIRGTFYLLLLMTLGLALMIPFGIWHKYTVFGTLKGLWAAPVLLLLCWFAVRLVLLGFKLEATRRIVCKPGELTLEGRGALLRTREHVRDPEALEARIIRVATKYGDVRWLNLRLRAPGGLTSLGYLELARDAEPTREARVQAAAALMATRLRVPLELRDEQNNPLPPITG